MLTSYIVVLNIPKFASNLCIINLGRRKIIGHILFLLILVKKEILVSIPLFYLQKIIGKKTNLEAR